MNDHQFLIGDVRDVLKTLETESVQCVVTSPPYWGLRDYGTAVWEGGDAECDHKNMASVRRQTMDGHNAEQPSRENTVKPYFHVCGKCGARRIDRQIGLESTPGEYVATMVDIFREVRRVLRNDGTLWLNLGDSYASGKGSCFNPGGGDNSLEGHARLKERGVYKLDRGNKSDLEKSGLKAKDLVGIPWRVAFALQADGWWLRQDLIWSKPNPMPESVTDRTTKSHEYIFLLSKSARYYYDAIAIREKDHPDGRKQTIRRKTDRYKDPLLNTMQGQEHERWTGYRNKRSVWTVPTRGFPGAHFATFPPKLIEPCILAGSSNRACAHCGAPWIRITETRDHANSLGKSWNDGTGRLQIGQRDCPSGDKAPVVVTIGWRSTCRCDNGGTSSSIVLDPFGGSGTTAVVAKRYGRRSIMIDLDPKSPSLRAEEKKQEELRIL